MRRRSNPPQDTWWGWRARRSAVRGSGDQCSDGCDLCLFVCLEPYTAQRPNVVEMFLCFGILCRCQRNRKRAQKAGKPALLNEFSRFAISLQTCIEIAAQNARRASFLCVHRNRRSAVDFLAHMSDRWPSWPAAASSTCVCRGLWPSSSSFAVAISVPAGCAGCAAGRVRGAQRLRSCFREAPAPPRRFAEVGGSSVPSRRLRGCFTLTKSGLRGCATRSRTTSRASRASARDGIEIQNTKRFQPRRPRNCLRRISLQMRCKQIKCN